MKKYIYLLPIMLSIVLTFHFTIILLSVIPFNPITLKLNHLVNNYTNPLFTQNWTLFAPDPVNSNDAVQIKLEFTDGNKSDWIDATNILIEKMHKNYFSPFNRMGRITQSITAKMLTEEPLINDFRKSIENKEGTEKSLKLLDENFEKQHEKYKKYLVRYGSSYAKYLFPDRDIETIEIRILNQQSIPFSKRNENISPEWKVVELIEKQPIIEDILPLM